MLSGDFYSIKMRFGFDLDAHSGVCKFSKLSLPFVNFGNSK